MHNYLRIPGTACINPPDPHSQFKIHPVWSASTDDPVPFGGTVNYTCETGVIPGATDGFGAAVYGSFVFQSDPDRSSMEVECLPSGYFDLPADWPFCVDSELWS